MLAMPGLRGYSLTEERGRGVSFGAHGVFVGDVALLQSSPFGAGERWSVRPTEDLNHDLSALYRLPVDVVAKTNALALVAEAFNRSDLAMAAIATVQMQWPELPRVGKGVETSGQLNARAEELFRSGLLKADWDPLKHPRTGQPPNPGQFALKPRVPSSNSNIGRWPSPDTNKRARTFALDIARVLIEDNPEGLALELLIKAFIAAVEPVDLNQGEDLLSAQLRASLQPPKTLEELQAMPTSDIKGFERHHIVEQNPNNLKKAEIRKFGPELINDPSNLVWIPHFPHLEISAEYSSKSDSKWPSLRDEINTLDFEQQRAKGLSMLRKYRVLK